MSHREESEEIKVLQQIEEDLDELVAQGKKLSFIKIQFNSGVTMLGPVKLTIGQKTKATVVGFDQTGAPWTGAIPPVTYALDQPTFDSSTPDGSNGDDIVSLAAGVANLVGSLTTVEGLALTDTETITNSAVVAVLSSVKIDFSKPA
jgi:hypothetical protein